MTKRNCKKCKYYYKHNVYHNAVCCRFPPTHKGQLGASSYPRIKDDTITCGEYTLRKKND